MKKAGITKQNPVKMERPVTDKFWTGMFAGTIVAILAICIYGLAAGDVYGLASPWDAAGNLCGNDSDRSRAWYKWEK